MKALQKEKMKQKEGSDHKQTPSKTEDENEKLEEKSNTTDNIIESNTTESSERKDTMKAPGLISNVSLTKMATTNTPEESSNTNLKAPGQDVTNKQKII